MQERVLFCDIDGVLNPMTPSWNFDFEFERIPYLEGDFSKEQIRNLFSLTSMNDIQFAWCSTWCTDGTADQLANWIKEFTPRSNATLAFTDAPNGAHNAKANAVKVALEQKKIVIWVDDQLPELCYFLSREHRENKNLLMVCADPDTGLTREDLNKIEAWISQF